MTGAIIRTLLVDDEALARRGIRQLLAAHPDVEIVGECRDGRSAASAIQALRPALVFLDIQMPELDGFGVLREVTASMTRDELPLTVFLTAFGEFALDAFGVEAVHYLVKPVSESRFDDAMRRVRHRLALPTFRDPAPAVDPATTSAPSPANLLMVATSLGQRFIPLDDIDWIAAEDYYVAVVAGGRRHLLREAMSSLEARLDRGHFVRVHRGAIVNIRRVRELRTRGNDTVIVLQDGTRVPVSRRRRAALLAALSPPAAPESA